MLSLSLAQHPQFTWHSISACSQFPDCNLSQDDINHHVWFSSSSEIPSRNFSWFLFVLEGVVGQRPSVPGFFPQNLCAKWFHFLWTHWNGVFHVFMSCRFHMYLTGPKPSWSMLVVLYKTFGFFFYMPPMVRPASTRVFLVFSVLLWSKHPGSSWSLQFP